METILTTYLIPILTLLFGYWSKGMYERRKEKRNDDAHEIDTHIELYAKMKKEFVILNDQLFEYQKQVITLISANEDLKETVSKLQKSVEKLQKEVHASNERAELYRKALQSQNKDGQERS